VLEVKGTRVTTIDLGGFNELRFCREGLFLYNKNDAYVGSSLKVYGEYGYAEAVMLYHLITPEDTAVEVGANIGAHTVGIARRAREVYAYEPQRLCFQLLCANLALNQCANAYAFMMGLGAEFAMMSVPQTDPTVRTNFGGLSLTDGGPGESVAVRTLDSQDLPAFSLLKIDVEGMELEVIKGAANAIDTYRPTIYCENDRRENSAALCAALKALDYTLYWSTPPLFNPNNYAHEKVNVFPRIVSVNLLCRPKPSDEAFGLAPVADPDQFWMNR
jgi:FkbM family methyltransferase